MKKVAIVGNGDYAKMLFRYLSMEQEYDVIGFVVEKAFIHDREIYGVPVIPVEKAEEKMPIKSVSLIMGIGYKQMGNIRKKLYNDLKHKGFEFINYIHPTAVISPNIEIGEGNCIFENVLIQEGVCIGNCNLIYGNSVIGHESVVGDFNSVSLNVTVAGCVKIGNNCFLGAASTMRDHIEIRDYALVGAAVYCSRNVESYSVLSVPKAIVLEGKKSTDINL